MLKVATEAGNQARVPGSRQSWGETIVIERFENVARAGQDLKLP